MKKINSRIDPYQLFLDSIKNKETQRRYKNLLDMFLKLIPYQLYSDHLGKTPKNRDLKSLAIFFVEVAKKDTDIVSDVIAAYIKEDKKRVEKGEISSQTLPNHIKPIKVLLDANRIPIHWKSLHKLMPRRESKSKDRAYSREEIQKMLDVTNDITDKVILLMFSSAGFRLESWDYFTWKDVIFFKNDDGSFKGASLLIYRGDPESYFTFITPEACNALILYREKWKADFGKYPEPDDPLIKSTTPLDVIMHYKVNGKPFTVVIDGNTEEIIDMQVYNGTGPMLPDNGLAVAYPNWDNLPIDGLRMDLTAPDFTYQPLTGWTALLLNAQKTGQNWGLCTPSEFPNAYFAQVGLAFVPSGSDFAWADTTTGCLPQFLFTSVFTGEQGDPTTVNSGNSLTFQITADDATDTWILYAYNVSTGDFWYNSKIVENTGDFQIGTPNTSIFFENPQTVNEGWNVGFTTDPVVNSAYERSSASGAWNYWSTEAKYAFNCDPGNLDWWNYISGNTQTGLTFDVSNIDSDCGI